MRISKHSLATGLFLALTSSAALAEPLPSNFTLGRYIPGDVWMFVNKTHNPERDWICAQWADVFKALAATDIDRDVLSLVLSAMPDLQRPELHEQIDTLLTTVRSVHWGDLIAGEIAFAERVTPKNSGYDYFFLSRTTPKAAAANLPLMVRVLEQFAALSDDLTATHTQRDHVDLWTLGPRNASAKEPRTSLTLFRKADLIGIVAGQRPMADVLALLKGDKTKPAISTSPRFREALTLVEAPEDGVLFFDFGLLLDSLSKLTRQLHQHDGKQPGTNIAARIVEKLIVAGNVLDFSVTSMETQGRREFSHTVTRLKPDKSKCLIACACLDRKPFARFDQYIPQDATAFSLNGSIDLAAIHKLLVTFVKENIPNGPGIVQAFDARLAAVGFDIERDFFSWWSGETINITLPASVVTPLGSTDNVLMFRVKDTALAARKVGSALDRLLETLHEHGQMLLIQPVDLGTGDFRQVTYPWLAMFARPVVGVADGWLMVATSSSALKRCLAVADGKADSIRKNARFIEEGIMPHGPVRSASFKDTSQFGAKLAGGMSMVSMFGTMALSAIPADSPGTIEAKQNVRRALALLTKLAPVLQRLDFFSSESSVTTYDGDRIIRTQTVITYKMPADADQTVKAKEPPLFPPH